MVFKMSAEENIKQSHEYWTNIFFSQIFLQSKLTLNLNLMVIFKKIECEYNIFPTKKVYNHWNLEEEKRCFGN